jgi:hypothetical protein
MSFLWHGLTEQGAQVPVQVDAQGRVIAVDGSPGVSNWVRNGTTLSPVNSGDNLNNIGSANFAGRVDVGGYPTGDGCAIQAYGEFNARSDSTSLTAVFSGYKGGLAPENLTSRISNDGSASFAGNVTAQNITFRSFDPQYYVKKNKNKDADAEYVGPELDLLAEIARLEALVRHLYETLRLTPPAGWPVWDGVDDVMRQLRK